MVAVESLARHEPAAFTRQASAVVDAPDTAPFTSNREEMSKAVRHVHRKIIHGHFIFFGSGRRGHVQATTRYRFTPPETLN